MLYERAVEIFNSPEKFEVHYKNSPVWINRVNNDRATAEISQVGGGEKLTVPVTELVEIGPAK